MIVERNSGDKYAIHTDSEYRLNCLTEWFKAWELNGWKTANGEEVANQDLIKGIVKLMASPPPCAGKVKMCKVQAHGSSYGNNMVDKYSQERKFFSQNIEMTTWITDRVWSTFSIYLLYTRLVYDLVKASMFLF